MLHIKIPTWEQLNENKSKLETLDCLGEHAVWTIWRSAEDHEVKFKDGKALISYEYNIPLSQKMIFRHRNSPDMCYFWNSIDPNNRRILLRAVDIQNDLENLEFFVWLGNRHCEWNCGHLLKSTVRTYFEADEELQKQWLLQFKTSMSGL